MNKLKLLLEIIKHSTKAKIIACSAGVGVIAIGGGIAYGIATNNNTTVADNKNGSEIVTTYNEKEKEAGKDKEVVKEETKDESKPVVNEEVKNDDTSTSTATTTSSSNEKPNATTSDTGSTTTVESTPTTETTTPTEPTKPDNNELPNIPYSKSNRNFALGSYPYQVELVASYNGGNISTTRNSALRVIVADLTNECVSLEVVKNSVIGKTIDGKYKITNVQIFKDTFPIIDGETDTEYNSRILSSSVFQQNRGALYFENTRLYHNDNDVNNHILYRAIINIEQI